MDSINNIDIQSVAENIHCPDDVVPGYLITKEHRHETHGIVAGGCGSRKPEIYQRAKIVEGTNVPCSPTIVRINKRTSQMHYIVHPMKHIDGFDYTENFDGMQQIGKYNIWINLKSVVGKGGSQTRTLRDECYPFIEAQLNYLLVSKATTCLFVNIFDGDEAHNRMPMFHYLLNLSEFESVKKYVYIGDLKEFFVWLKSKV